MNVTFEELLRSIVERHQDEGVRKAAQMALDNPDWRNRDRKDEET